MKTSRGKVVNTRHRSRRQIAFAIAGLVLGAIPGSSQILKRSVRGKVTDQKGLHLKGAAVRLKNLESLRIRSYIVQGDGLYHFANLRADLDYELKATFLGATSAAIRLDRFDSRAEAIIDLKIDISERRSAMEVVGRGRSNPGRDSG